jgi:hypothetical protein
MDNEGALGGRPVRGPDGRILTIADLPPLNTKRWVIRRKAILAAAVRGGLITLDMACSRYRLNAEELLSWQYYIDRYGFQALRTTRVQSYVRPEVLRPARSSSNAHDSPRQRREPGEQSKLRYRPVHIHIYRA